MGMHGIYQGDVSLGDFGKWVASYVYCATSYAAQGELARSPKQGSLFRVSAHAASMGQVGSKNSQMQLGP